MVVFFVFVMISVVVGEILTRRTRSDFWDRSKIMIICVTVGISLGVVASSCGGIFVRQEIIVEKYFIQPMIFDGKIIVGLVEDLPSYTFQIKEGDKTRLIKHCLNEKNIFFTCGDGKERYLEIRRGKTCRKNMWVWFFYGGTGILESKAVLKKGDSFLILPKYYSL